MPKYFFKLKTESDLAEPVSFLSENLKLPAFVSLSGDLGAGKTTFVRHLVATLSQNQTNLVNSPTFTKLHEYRLPQMNIYHLDFYRSQILPEELHELMSDPKALVLIEWFENFDCPGFEADWQVQISHLDSQVRSVVISC